MELSSSSTSSKTNLTSGSTTFGGQTCSSKRIVLAVVIGGVILAVVVGLAVGVPLSQRKTKRQAETAYERAIRILEEYPLIDGHNDLSWQYRVNVQNRVYDVNLNMDLATKWNITHTDIGRMKQGRLAAQFWAIFALCDGTRKDAVRQFLDQTDTIKKFVAKYPDTFKFVTTADGILEAWNDGKIASLLGLEGGHAIDSSLGVLRMFYDIGVRYMTLTHNCNTPWADNWKVDTPDDEPWANGLSEYGVIVVKEMNRLGMMLDLSHVSKQTMIDALQASQSPVIYSHSSSFAYCNHYRNVQDDVLQMTKTNGGLLMINFYNPYINCAPNLQNTTTLSQVADHIEYVKNLIGVEHVGIGADYDGVPDLPVGLEDVSTYPSLFEELINRGWTDEELKMLAGKNIIRVMKKNEEIRDSLANIPPYEDLVPPELVDNNTCRTGF